MFETTNKDQTIDDITQMLESEEFSYLPIDLIDPDPNQPRVVFKDGELEDLAGTIRAGGVKLPIIVTPADHGRYMIVDGERRWRASNLASMHDIPAVIKRNVTENEREDIQLLSFFSRVDLNPVEIANALELMITKRESAKAVSSELGVSESWISQRRKILSLPQDVQQLAIDGFVIDKAALNNLGALPDDERQHKIEMIKAGAFNSSELAKPKKKKSLAPKDSNILSLEKMLSEVTGSPFVINHNDKKGSGSVKFTYSSLEQLDGILSYFNLNRDDDSV